MTASRGRHGYNETLNFLAELHATTNCASMTKTPLLPLDHISGIIEMALSDHVSFSDIEAEYGLREPQVKALMRANLKSGSYKVWRKRVRDFSDRRAHYK